MTMTTKVIKDNLARVATQMRELDAKAKAENRGFTAEDEQTWTNLRNEHEKLERELDRAKFAESKLAGEEQIVRQFIRDENGNPVELGREDRRAESEQRGSVVTFCGKEVRTDYTRTGRPSEPAELGAVFDAFLRRGLGVLKPEHQALMQSRYSDSDEIRAQSIGTPSAGGYAVPQDFANTIDVALKQFSGIRNAATVITSSDGRSLPWPTVNDTTNSGVLVAENAGDTEQDVAFGVVTYGAYTFSSKIVRVSLELLQDSGVDVGALLGRLLGERLGRGTAAYYATGTGSSQPQGFVTAATLGKTAASATAFTYQEMLDLKHSVDPAYRMSAKWAMHDTVLRAVKALVGSDGRPLWQPSVADKVPATIDGDQFIIDQSMSSALTTAQRVMAYGDLSKFQIRDVLGYQLVVLRELYAANRQVGFNMFMRTDSKLLDAGTNPIKYLRLA
jgi:HK97 family phage major capsid protein